MNPNLHFLLNINNISIKHDFLDLVVALALHTASVDVSFQLGCQFLEIIRKYWERRQVNYLSANPIGNRNQKALIKEGEVSYGSQNQIQVSIPNMTEVPNRMV